MEPSPLPLPSLISSPFFSPFLWRRGGRSQREAEKERRMFCVHFPALPSLCGRGGLWHGDRRIPRTLRIRLDPLCPARGPAAADIACDLDFLGRSSQCLDDCADGLCGPGIVKAVCPRDATRWSVSVRSQGREGRECSPFADFPIPFLCLSGTRQRGRCWPHAGRLSLTRRGPSSPPARSGAAGERWERQPGLCWQRLSTDVSAPCVRDVSGVCERRR